MDVSLIIQIISAVLIPIMSVSIAYLGYKGSRLSLIVNSLDKQNDLVQKRLLQCESDRDKQAQQIFDLMKLNLELTSKIAMLEVDAQRFRDQRLTNQVAEKVKEIVNVP